ncbi:MAG: hypothetical protein FVQ85_16365 [Planctomycetes bacterium]|nr:hypothetical protein [Planctomycetota bacterium]
MSIKDEIEQIKVKIEELEGDLRLEKAVLARLESISTRKRKPVRSSPSGPPRKGSLAAYLQKALQDSNCALSVSELVERVKQAGFVSTAKVGLNNLIPSSLVRRPDIFVRVSHGVYDLKTRAKQEIQTE